jgi:hypothetical protein
MSEQGLGVLDATYQKAQEWEKIRQIMPKDLQVLWPAPV